jgi:hypothetical protein
MRTSGQTIIILSLLLGSFTLAEDPPSAVENPNFYPAAPSNLLVLLPNGLDDWQLEKGVGQTVFATSLISVASRTWLVPSGSRIQISITDTGGRTARFLQMAEHPEAESHSFGRQLRLSGDERSRLIITANDRFIVEIAGPNDQSAAIEALLNAVDWSSLAKVTTARFREDLPIYPCEFVDELRPDRNRRFAASLSGEEVKAQDP